MWRKHGALNHRSLASEIFPPSFRMCQSYLILSDLIVKWSSIVVVRLHDYDLTAFESQLRTVKYDIKLPNLYSTIHFRCHSFYNYNPFIFCGISVAAFDPEYIAISDDFRALWRRNVSRSLAIVRSTVCVCANAGVNACSEGTPVSAPSTPPAPKTSTRHCRCPGSKNGA